jgi:phosphoribosylformylglycinamidine cyclo-ligase
MAKSEYAQDVNYEQIEPFKQAMQRTGRRTLEFPRRRHVRVEPGAHGAIFEYFGRHPHRWAQTQEGLGNKNWIAEWMYQNAGTGRTYYGGIGIDAALMAVNDLIAQGAMPVLYTDEVAAGDSEWFQDERRAKALAESFYRICEEVGMALPAGESPSLRYLVNAVPPVKSAPSLSGCATGIIAPNTRCIAANRPQIGDHILGAPASGLHANGVSLVIRRALTLPEQFLTKLPNGNTLGEEALIPTRSYVALVEALLEAQIDIHAFLPGTGGGVAKIAVDRRPFQYRIHSWVDIPPLFLFLRELGVSLMDCLTTFNWGIGYYAFVPPHEVERAIQAAAHVSHELHDLGIVEDGERQVIFEPENIRLPPPG